MAKPTNIEKVQELILNNLEVPELILNNLEVPRYEWKNRSKDEKSQKIFILKTKFFSYF